MASNLVIPINEKIEEMPNSEFLKKGVDSGLLQQNLEDVNLVELRKMVLLAFRGYNEEIISIIKKK